MRRQKHAKNCIYSRDSGNGGLASSSQEGGEPPTGSIGKRMKKPKKVVKGKLSFVDDDLGVMARAIGVTP